MLAGTIPERSTHFKVTGRVAALEREREREREKSVHGERMSKSCAGERKRSISKKESVKERER
jgi:hypothetical protein